MAARLPWAPRAMRMMSVLPRCELNPIVRRQILTKMQQIIHERVMFAPVLEYAYLVSIGPRVAFDGVNAIPDDPYTAHYEDLRLKRR